MISMVVLGIVHLQGKHVYKANPMENSALIWDSTQMGTKQAPDPSLESATRVEFCPVRVTRGLAFATAAVVGACVCVTSLSIFLGRPSMFGLGPLFDMNREANIPAVYSALLLLAAAALLALIARLERSRKAGFSHYWAVLAVGFVYLSADELIRIHEHFNRPLRDLLGTSSLATTWVIPGALAAFAAGIYFLPFLRALPARLTARFVLAGAVFVGSAVGLEIVQELTRLYRADGHYRADGQGWAALGMVTLEEGGEMAGVVLFIRALVDLLSAAGARLEVTFRPAADADAMDEPAPSLRQGRSGGKQSAR